MKELNTVSYYVECFHVAALAGFALSALIWLGVAVATPAPVTVLDAAKEGARRVHDRLPQEIRQRPFLPFQAAR